jgi:hypothetical protein
MWATGLNTLPRRRNNLIHFRSCIAALALILHDANACLFARQRHGDEDHFSRFAGEEGTAVDWLFDMDELSGV